MGKKKDGVKLFHDYYEGIYGSRWSQLLAALSDEREDYWSLLLDLTQSHAGISGLTAQHREGYFIDPASVLAISSLGIEPGDRVLDACSAPGGKALVALRFLKGEGHLVCNERSATRLQRLRMNLERFGIYPNFTTRQGDAGEPRRDGELFDKIIVDVPCSSERHWIHDQRLNDWRPGRAKYLAISQHRILCNCWERLRPGGVLLYSTCAISQVENDGVIERFLKKREATVHTLNQPFEKTQYGMHILPDQADGWGPLYFARLGKQAE